MTRTGYTHIETVIDRSGSMYTIRDDMESGYNQFIEDQKKEPGFATVGLSQFDTTHDYLYSMLPINTVPRYTLKPRGGTALVDALCDSIDKLGKDLAARPESERPQHVVFVIVTDGGENASVRYKRNDVKRRIETQQGQYGWTFIFLGANQDAFSEAHTYGIPQWSTINYAANDVGTQAVYAATSRSVSGLRGGTVVAGAANFFSKADREAAEGNDPIVAKRNKK